MKKPNTPIITLTTLALTALVSLLAGCATKTAAPVSAGAPPKPRPLTGGAPITVYCTPVANGGSLGSCPGAYAGYVLYTNSSAWGWSPDTNNTTVFTAADGGGRTDTSVFYNGRLPIDKGCAQTTVTIPNPPMSTQYRFCIYFPSNVPTTNYPIVLTGFK